MRIKNITMTSLLARPELLSLLDCSDHHRLTLIISPSGYGKTTLLSQWHSGQKHKTVTRFCVPEENFSVNAALNSILLEVRKQTQVIQAPFFNVFTDDVQVNEKLSVDTLVLVFEFFKEEMYFIIDDFQYLNFPNESNILNNLLVRMPSNVHFIFSSRSIPKINLIPLKLNDDVLIIDSHDLSMSVNEVASLSDQMCQYPLTGYDIKLIADRTEGWLSGIKIALLAINEHGLDFIKNLEKKRIDIMDSFFHDIYTSLTQEGKQFFLFSAIFKCFNQDLCDRVLGRNNSEKFIRYLMNRSAFIIKDNSRPGWYRYHSLLNDFLNKQLSQLSGSDVLKRLHKVSTLTCIEMNEFELAAYHCLLTKDDDFIGDSLTQCCHYWLKEGDFNNAIKWLDAICEKKLLNNTNLSLNYAYALIFSRRFHQAQYFISLIDSTDSGKSSSDFNDDLEFLKVSLMLFQRDIDVVDRHIVERLVAQSHASDNRVFSMVIAAYFEMQHGRLDDAMRLAQHAKIILEKKGYVFFQCYADMIVALCDRYTGRGIQAIQYISKIYNTAKMTKGSMPWLCLNVAMMVVTYEQNHIKKSHAICEMVLPYVNHACVTELIATVYLYFSRLQFDLGSTHSARGVLEQLNRILILGKYPRFKSQSLCELTRQCYVNADHVLMEKLLSEHALVLSPCDSESVGVINGDSFDEIQERYTLATCYAHGLNAQFSLAYEKLNRLSQELLSLGLISRYVIAKCNAIVMQYRAGKIQKSLSMLDVLLQEYTLSVLSRNVFDEAPGINDVLLTLSNSGAIHLPQSFLVIYHDLFDQIKPMVSFDLASLTDKEVKIYQLLKSGLSNQDISNEMNVALSTTKWHLKNIYQKLGVKNRAEILVMNNREPLIAAQSSMT